MKKSTPHSAAVLTAFGLFLTTTIPAVGQLTDNFWESTGVAPQSGSVNNSENWSEGRPDADPDFHMLVNDTDASILKNPNMNTSIATGGFTLGSAYTWNYQSGGASPRSLTLSDILVNDGFIDVLRSNNDGLQQLNYNGSTMDNQGTIRMRVTSDDGGAAEMNLSDTNTNEGTIQLQTAIGGVGVQTSLNITGSVSFTNEGSVSSTSVSTGESKITGVAGSSYIQAAGSTTMGTNTDFEVPTLEISGGTFALSGDSTDTDRISDTVNITMSGGTFDSDGLSERGTTTAGMGLLTLDDTATIDMGSDSSILWFDEYDHQDGILNISNWGGVVGDFGGMDQLRFTEELTTGQLGSILFNGQYAAQQAFFDTDGDYWEVAAIPEPKNAVLLLGLFSSVVLLVIRRRR